MPRKPTDFNVMREKASLLITEMDLDEEGQENAGRDDGGLYAYVDNGVVIRSQNTCRTFTDWPALEMYLEMVHELDEQGVTDAGEFDDAEFERRLARITEGANHGSE
jgi:hypothetical protein